MFKRFVKWWKGNPKQPESLDTTVDSAELPCGVEEVLTYEEQGALDSHYLSLAEEEDHSFTCKCETCHYTRLGEWVEREEARAITEEAERQLLIEKEMERLRGL